MSHPTPRKSRHRQQPSGGGARTVAASDYESDAPQYLAAPNLPPQSTVARLSNTELNLSVLRRYLPSIRSIVSIAANAVVYTISPTTGQWEKSGVEGTLLRPVAITTRSASSGPSEVVTTQPSPSRSMRSTSTPVRTSSPWKAA